MFCSKVIKLFFSFLESLNIVVKKFFFLSGFREGYSVIRKKDCFWRKNSL